jgi:hypothetical protein
MEQISVFVDKDDEEPNFVAKSVMVDDDTFYRESITVIFF